MKSHHSRRAVLAARMVRWAERQAKPMYLLFNIQDPNSFPRADEYPKNEKSERAISKTSDKRSGTAGKGRQNLIYYHPKESFKGKTFMLTGQEQKERRRRVRIEDGRKDARLNSLYTILHQFLLQNPVRSARVIDIVQIAACWSLDIKMSKVVSSGG